MLRDVLGMFETTGTRRSEQNLRVAFNFDEASPALSLTVQEFREIEEIVRYILRPVLERIWDSQTLFSLNDDISKVLKKIFPQNPMVDQPRVSDTRIEDWIERNGKPNWLTFPEPGFQRTGGPGLDSMLDAAERLIHSMYVEITKLGATCGEFRRRISESPWDDVK